MTTIGVYQVAVRECSGSGPGVYQVAVRECSGSVPGGLYLSRILLHPQHAHSLPQCTCSYDPIKMMARFKPVVNAVKLIVTCKCSVATDSQRQV